MQLEQNPTNPNNQAELVAKKQQLAELETKQKELTKSLSLPYFTFNFNLLHSHEKSWGKE